MQFSLPGNSWKIRWWLVSLSGCLVFGHACAWGQSSTSPNPVADLRAKVDAAPQDAQLRYKLALALTDDGKVQQAATQYLEATSLQPTMYLAYHQLTLLKGIRDEQLDEGIERLKGLENDRPKDLMLRVALSELYERRGQNYPAARALVDLVYENAVPDKYLTKVQNRIHFLLAKCKDAQEGDPEGSDTSEMDTAPVPLPETGLKRTIAKKGKEGRPAQGFGNNTMLP